MKYHFLIITISEDQIYRLINTCKIPIKDIKFQNNRATFIIDFLDKDNFLNDCKKNNIAIEEIQEKGISTFINNFPFKKTVLCFVFLFILLMLVNSLFIWKISFDGNYSYSNNQLKAYLSQLKCSEGMLKSKFDCNELEENIREKYSEISWVCCEVKGTNLIVHIKENYITDVFKIDKKPFNIISKYNGKIVSILTNKGTGCVRKNTIVKKGQLLISGMVRITDESGEKLFTKITQASGRVIGEVKFKYKNSININYKKQIIVKCTNKYLPYWGEYRWKINKKKDTNISYSENRLKFFGNYYIPVGIEKIKLEKVKELKAEYTNLQCKTILIHKLNKKLALLEEKGYKIIKKNVKIYKDNKRYKIQSLVVCHVPMGKVSYITHEAIEKEKGTSSFNERN